MSELPTGTVTLLFTDLEVSTRLWDLEPDAMREALARHDGILRDAVEAQGGVVVKGRGDGVHAVFATADAAVRAAIACELALDAEVWPVSEPLRARVGIHTGVAELRDGDYFGSAVNRAARLEAIAHGGQIVCSQATADLAREVLAEGVAFVDLGEHRLRDLSRPERVFQVNAASLQTQFGPLASVDAFRSNLPVQLTSLVGRAGELARVCNELAQARVVTLTGVGGVGKTRLALEVAAELLSDYREGAWLVELAAVRDADLVPDAVVATFGLQPRVGSSASETLLEFLRAKSLLLVVDNCEHLLEAVGGLVDQVVGACPEVRVLATSREGLNVASERILGVPSLRVPDDGASLEVVAASDAVVLFVERARAVKTGFALDAANAGAVAQVCSRLDGIPLAIELAAARVAMLTPAELARRLDQRFRVLAGGRRSRVERHQTLRATVDWSYELLSKAEQLLLDRLSIFVGGFSLEAVEAVCSDTEIPVEDVFEVVARLVAHHLVVADDTGVETRYRLLETIRQYAQEHLDEREDTDQLRTEHATYYMSFGEDAVANATGPEGIDWERRLKQEFDNLRAALAWAVDTHDTDTAVRLLGMCDSPLLVTYFVPASAIYWAADAVLALPGADDHPRYPSALVVGAYSAYAGGDPELARCRCDDALAAEERLGTEPSIGLPLVRAWVALIQGHPDDILAHSKHALEMARVRGESPWLIYALAYTALACAIADDAAGARAHAEEILALRQHLASTRGVQTTVLWAAWALRDSEPQRALDLTREMFALGTPELGVNWLMAADITVYSGERRDALTYFDHAIDALSWLGQRPELRSTFGLVAVVLVDDDLEAAAVLFGASDVLAADVAHTPRYRQARQDATATLEASLGKNRYTELQASGAAMNDTDATHYAHAAINRSLDENRAQ